MKEMPFAARSQPKTSPRRDTSHDRKAPVSIGHGAQELQSVNIALAQQLAQERMEHEKDITEANVTIKQLQAALSQMRDRLEETESEQNRRVQGVATSLRGLQEQLRMQEETKSSSEVRAQQLAEFVRELRKQTEFLHLHVKDRDAQLSLLRSDYDDSCKKAAVSQVSAEVACARLEKLETEVVQLRSDLSTSGTLVEQLKGSLEDSQQQVEQLRSKEKRVSEDQAALQDKAIKLSTECEQLKHVLQTEKNLHAKCQEDLNGLRAENKDLISQTANVRALTCSVAELKDQRSKLQAERDSMEACVLARAQELESLTAENARLKGDWKLREDGLSSSHEIRIQHLMKSLQEREQQNCDLHKSLHKAKVRIESVQSESGTHLERSQKAAEAVALLEQKCVDLSRQLDEESNRHSELIVDAAESSRVQSSKLAERDAELARMQQSCHDLQARVESLLLQMQNQMSAHASLKQQLEDSEKNSIDQVSKLTASIKEISEKLLECQHQHDQSAASADSTIQQLNNKLTEAISEAAVLKAALETAALENESNQNEITSLQRNLEMCTRDLNSAKHKLDTCAANADGLKLTLHQKQTELESIIQRQEKMLKVVTNAMSVEEQAKLSAQKQLRAAKERLNQLDQELTDVMGKLADANERARDIQSERDDALDSLQALRRKLDFQRRQDQADKSAAARRPYDVWLHKSSRALGLGSPDKYPRTAHSVAGELSRPTPSSLLATDEMSSYQQRLAEIRARD